ncbi:MAG: DUF2796 domain-containing protein [Mitsuaria chitosanitabida]|uniref:DUF2796 domain-containing protein n=1 Tax=Roseateles chitosanitabidus TaxID=65048 RepID=UPI001B0A55F7|nr:DUF2796 domain-containing protein [Roseateles chitosanitabidus]MBO9685587.1 DUF2796 domain-containing protein [Roseateles chitosanitabidus]
MKIHRFAPDRGASRPTRVARTSSAARAATHVATIVAGLALLGSAQAHGDKHEHGVVHLDVAVEGDLLTLQLESPLDSVLGFEHQPRTPAQRAAVEQMLQRLRDGAALFTANAPAGCRFEDVQIESGLIVDPKPAPAATAAMTASTATAATTATTAPKGKHEHLDVDASYRFRCASSPALTQLTHQLFAVFPRIQRVEAQIATPRGQSRQVLKRPAATLSIGGDR